MFIKGGTGVIDDRDKKCERPSLINCMKDPRFKEIGLVDNLAALCNTLFLFFCTYKMSE
jgi:hypothetical protein